MWNVAMQLQVQRGRFAHHAVAALAARLPEQIRAFIVGSPSIDHGAPAASEAALQAQEVREMARTYQRTDPAFAADLYAAAARHEGLSAD